MLSTCPHTLHNYQNSAWGHAMFEGWECLCGSLRNYDAPYDTWTFEKERKWELVSAFQKAIRRGDKWIALRLIAAMQSMPTERAYFWKRLCVIACEDIGPADDCLAAFAIACAASVRKNAEPSSHDLFCFLTEQMCDRSTRSRIYCSLGVIESAVSESVSAFLIPEDAKIASAIRERVGRMLSPTNPWEQWQRKNDWRAEGLLKYVGLTLPFEMLQTQLPLPPPRLLFGLPSYCYDMHTRVGLEMLKRLARGVEGGEGIKELFQQNKVKSPHRALGEALFYVEGGRIQGELFHQPLYSLEQRLAAHRTGLSLDSWLALRNRVQAAVDDGVIDRVREEVLHQRYDRLWAT